MADTYVTNQGFSPVNTRELMRQNESFQNRQGVVGNEGFSNALNSATNVMATIGPAVGAATPHMGFKGGAITTAALSAFGAPGGGFSTPGYGGGSATGYGAGKFLAPPGGAPGFPGAGGGAGIGTAPGFPGGGGVNMNAAGGAMDPSAMDNQIALMQNSNLTMLALQTKVQNVSQMSQMMSNIAKTDSDAKLNAIRNVRA